MFAIVQLCQQHVQSMPQNTVRTAAASFIFSCAITAILSSGTFYVAVGAGAFAATASLIDSAIRPILEDLTPTHTLGEWSKFFLRTIVILAVDCVAGIGYNPLLAILLSNLIPEIADSLGWDTHPRNASPYFIIG